MTAEMKPDDTTVDVPPAVVTVKELSAFRVTDAPDGAVNVKLPSAFLVPVELPTRKAPATSIIVAARKEFDPTLAEGETTVAVLGMVGPPAWAIGARAMVPAVATSARNLYLAISILLTAP
jgi:hypothetical protein